MHVLSALNTGRYKWVKDFVSLLQHLTSNEFTWKDSFKFAKTICEYVDSLFTNVPLEEIINIYVIYVNELFKSNINIYGLNKKNRLPRCFL